MGFLVNRKESPLRGYKSSTFVNLVAKSCFVRGMLCLYLRQGQCTVPYFDKSNISINLLTVSSAVGKSTKQS